MENRSPYPVLKSSLEYVPKPPSAGHLLVSVLVLCLEGLCTGNPESAGLCPKRKHRDRLGCGTDTSGTYNRLLCKSGFNDVYSSNQLLSIYIEHVERQLSERIVLRRTQMGSERKRSYSHPNPHRERRVLLGPDPDILSPSLNSPE